MKTKVLICAIITFSVLSSVLIPGKSLAGSGLSFAATGSGNPDKITLYKRSSNEMEIYGRLPDNKLLLVKFSKKDWGTWNIKGWYLSSVNKIPDENPYHIAGCNTDSEYVLRVSEKTGLPCRFSGGNHGNEVLRSIRFINPSDGSEINLKLCNKATLDSLKVIENTTLTLDNTILKRYADIQRVYVFRPKEIILETRFVFTSDVYMSTSYTCMFPVTKEYGRHVKFQDSGHVYTTPAPGQTLSKPGFDHYIGREKALSAEIWGAPNPSYVFRVWVGNTDMVDCFSNDLKTFYWDLNKYTNKLYFSKFNTDEYRKISKGTVWNSIQGWELKINEGTLRLGDVPSIY